MIRCLCEFSTPPGVHSDAADILGTSSAASLENPETGAYVFDGASSSVDITDRFAFGSAGLASRFTVSTWMKHDGSAADDDDGGKQHVMCSSDNEGERLVC